MTKHLYHWKPEAQSHERAIYYSTTTTEWEQKCAEKGDGQRGIQSDKNELLWLGGNK